MDEQDMRSDEENEGYEDFQDVEEDEDVDDDDETAFDDVDYGLEEGDGEGEPSHRLANKRYAILAEEDIRARQAAAVESVVSVLSVSKSYATLLLRHCKWSVGRVEDEWFQDEDEARKAVGLVEPEDAKPRVEEEITCGICFETCQLANTRAPLCRQHNFCLTCWRGYAENSISEGPGCLSLRCADPSCKAAVEEDMILALVSPEARLRYQRYALRSYVEDNRKAKWCPAPGCDFAAEYVPGSATFDIVCRCGHPFCWNCLEEVHRPVECVTVGQWMVKNSAESENMNWILANAKPCPKCKRPIEKNQGCMHMSCTPPCKFEFCWLCLGEWSEHGERTGGFYACNRYETAKNEGVYDESEKRREFAKNSLEKYTHYYERWASNVTSRLKAQKDLKVMQESQLEVLGDVQCQPVSQLKFVLDAMHQVVECRRVLKWTYAYGYYLPEKEEAKRNFFEYLQGEAESGLERLHDCVEKELRQFLSGPPDVPATATFNEYRTKLAGLTSVTNTYFINLVKALESGLEDCKVKILPPSTKLSRPKSNNDKKKKGKEGSGWRGQGGASRGLSEESPAWACLHCTTFNLSNTTTCTACALPRTQ